MIRDARNIELIDFSKRIQGIPSSLLEHFQKILFDHSIDINLGELSRPWQNTHDHPIIYAQKDEHSGNLMVSQVCVLCRCW